MKQWDTGDKHNVADECSWADGYKGANIHITAEIYAVIRKMCKEVKIEWQMMLTGTESKDGVYITGYWIPKQEVSTASVKNLDIIDKDVIAERKIICGVHSHGNMACFFSAVDDESTNNSLIKNNIVVNNKGDYKAVMRYETPCGMVHFFDATLEIGEGVAVEIEGLENIERTTTTILGCGYKVGDKYKGNEKFRHALNDDAKYYGHLGYMGGYIGD